MNREAFLAVRFDGSCQGYGHEDTLFGAELQRRAIPILHIDTPLQHDGLEPNDVYLAKTREALTNLYRQADRLQNHSPLLSAFRHVERLHLIRPLARVYAKRHTCWERRLCHSAHPSLLLFKIYKLAHYASLHV